MTDLGHDYSRQSSPTAKPKLSLQLPYNLLAIVIARFDGAEVYIMPQIVT